MLEKLKSELVKAMKEQNRLRLVTLREIKGAMDLEHINRQVEITEELLTEVVSKQIKMRNESYREFEKANRQDLIDKINNELVILKEFLPKQLDDDEIKKIIDEAFVRVKPEKPSDMGLIMKEVTPALKGKADMRIVSDIIKDKLSNL